MQNAVLTVIFSQGLKILFLCILVLTVVVKKSALSLTSILELFFSSILS